MGTSKIKLSAIVSGFPAGFRPPKPLPGESLAQLVIRTHAYEWLNCIERLQEEFHASQELCSRLRKGDLAAVVDPVVKRQIERFMNLRLPSHERTLRGLAEIQERLQEPGGLNQLWPLQLTEIIWPRQKDTSGNTEAEKLAASLGVTVVAIDTLEPRPLDLGYLLKYVHGAYLWILPGGSRLSGPTTIMALSRVLRGFHENPKLALYSDQSYCMIYRTSALRTLIASGKTLSAELRDNARMLQEATFELAADNDPICRLVEVESLYGGPQDTLNKMHLSKRSSSRIGETSWWRRLLGPK